MKKWKRLLCVFLAGALGVSALGACAKKDGETGNSTQSTGGKVAMGRYVEEEISLPFEGNEETVFDIIQKDDGSLELYTGTVGNDYKINTVNRYDYDGSNWSQAETWVKNVVESTVALGELQVKRGLDGTEYLLYNDKDYHPHLLRSADGVQYEEIMTDLLGKPVEGYEFYPRPEAFEGLTNDRIFISSYWFTSGIYNADGTLYMAMELGHASTDRRSDYAFSDKEIVIRSERGLERYNIEQKNKLEDIQTMENVQFQMLKMDKDGGLYAADSAGIHHIAKGGSIWETIVDGTLNSLGMPSMYLHGFFIGNDNTFYALMNSSDSKKLLRYAYDPNMASVPSTTLNVYGLKDSATVQQAAALFQKSHPDVRVVVNSAVSGYGEVADEDVIRTLNTELLSGKGADVLLLDGLPVQSYIDKGVLADITDVIAPYEQNGELLKTVLDAYKIDGKIYRFPARISLPLVVGGEKMLAALDSLEAFKEYHEAGNPAAFRMTNYENILRLETQMFYSDIFAEDGAILPGALKSLLETAKAAGVSCGAKTIFEEAAMGRDAEYYNMVLDRGYALAGMFNYFSGVGAIGIEEVDGESGIMTVTTIADQMGVTLNNLRGTYLPEHIVGVNASSPNLELAKEFVSLIFSQEVQKDNLYDGIAVNTEAAKIWAGKKVETMISTSIRNDDGAEVELTCTWPGEERANEILAMAAQCPQPVDVNEVLMKMIVEEAAGYFDGEITLDEAVSAIENKTNLYFSE